MAMNEDHIITEQRVAVAESRFKADDRFEGMTAGWSPEDTVREYPVSDPEFPSFECSCGESFGTREEAKEHILGHQETTDE